MKLSWKRPHLWVAFLYLAIIVRCDPLSVAPLAILFCGLSGAVFFISSRHPKDFNFLFGIFAGSLLLRVFMILLFYQLSYMPFCEHPQFLILNDGYPYSENGWHLLQFRREEIPFDLSVFVQKGHALASQSGGIGPYDFWNAAVYSIVGKQPMAMFFINAIIGMLPVLLLYDMSQQLVSLRAARMTALLSAFWPSLFLWSTQNLKEPLVVYLAVQFVWATVMLRRRFTLPYLGTAAISLCLLYRLSLHVFIVLCFFSLPLSLAFGSKAWLRLSRDTKILMVAVLIASLLLAATALVYWATHSYWLTITDFTLWQYLGYMHKSRGQGAESAFLQGFDIKNLGTFLLYLPLGFLYAFLSPFPWQVGSAQQTFGVVEMGFFYFLLPSLYRGAKYLLRVHFRETCILIFYLPVMLAVMCVMEGNIGTLFRHRSYVLPFLILMIGTGKALRSSRAVT